MNYIAGPGRCAGAAAPCTTRSTSATKPTGFSAATAGSEQLTYEKDCRILSVSLLRGTMMAERRRLMSEGQKWERATERARTTRRRALLTGRKGEVTTYRIRCGGSCGVAEAHRYHLVAVGAYWDSCDCPRGQFDQPCVHRGAVRRRLERENARAKRRDVA